jgi:site-specific DNA-cytosine methylase
MIKLSPNSITLSDIVSDEFDIEKYALSETHLNAFKKSYNWKHCELYEKSKPLLASYYKQPPHCPYVQSNISKSGYRRLSPIECERLQTIPDNYTEGVSDSQRYKCIGNAWTVDVIAHLYSGLRN